MERLPLEISFIEDITIGNSDINTEEIDKDVKKTEKKAKKKIVKRRASAPKKKSPALKKDKIKDKIPEDEIISPIKDIKDKK